MATKRYGQWIIVKSLPEGGQAHTFLVRREGDPSSKQFVLKRLKNPQRIQRFRHELEAVKRLSHTNVLKWIDHDLEHVSPYIVTEYCPGGTLSTLNVTRSAVLDRLRMFAAICDGVAHAHEHDVIHRDLKLGNIFLRSDLSPVVGDFGLCLLSDEEERLTRSDEVVGARWYSAPELEDGRAETITYRADVYALGKILYWMLAGRIFAREKHRDPEFDLTKRYPEPSFFLINELLDSLIAADLSRRYEFAQEVAHAVRQLIKRIEARGHAMDPGAPQPGIYCAQGLYQPIVDCVNRDPRREYHEERQIMQTFGFLESHSASRISWLIFICDTCGNVQLFRPDFVRNQSAWKSR